MNKLSVYILLLIAFSCKKSNVEIIVSPQNIVLGNNIDICFEGLQANTLYTVYLQKLTNSKSLVELSSAQFQSDKKGKISIDKDFSLGGSFLGKDSLGLFYMLDTISVLPFFLNDIRKEKLDAKANKNYYSIQIVADEKRIAEKQFSLLRKTKNSKHTKIKQGSVIVDLYSVLPKSREMTIVLGGSEGNNFVSNYIAQLLASNGINASAISYFGNATQGYALKEVPLERIDSSLLWIEKQMKTPIDLVNIIGVSRGAELALLFASYSNRKCNVFAFSPSYLVFSGNPFKAIPAWTYQAKPLVFTPFPNTYHQLKFDALGKPIYAPHIKNVLRKAVLGSQIPVENIQGKIYLFSGTDDLLWASSTMADDIEKRLKEKAFTYHFENFKYKKAGHSILLPPYTASKDYGQYALGGSNKANAYARLHSWNFLLRKLTKEKGIVLE